ncbi:MAG: type I restriction enzyme HsdR N-terminal domain-containing protein [Candidatus Poribacteria bacterium]|nr:type I restriction enzyme HsdR N-terminal domain-containing protein [Candidatus Poribacteria bacterium]
MDFIDEVRTRSGRFQKRIDKMADSEFIEEQTKTSFVLPFIQMLGYDIFDPLEVVPEFTADVGTKKHEKVDFALMKDGDPVLLIEVKKAGTDLGGEHISQLLRYFGVTEARFAILTNGLNYLFFTDLDQHHIMDQRPFFEFNMLDFTEVQVRELRRFTKEQFDTNSIVDAARELKYTGQIMRLLADELSQPSDEFVRFVTSKVYEGRATSGVRKMFTDLTHSAFNQFISDKVRDRLSKALKQENETADTMDDVKTQKWVSIPGYGLPGGSPPPVSIRFWDNDTRPVKVWYEVLTVTVDKVYGEGLIKMEDTPIRSNNRKAVYVHSEPVRQDGTAFRRFEKVGNPPLFVNTNLSGEQARNLAVELLKKCRIDPTTVHLEVG